MKHVIFGGDGFVGRYLASDLAERGEEVLVADIAKSDLPHYAKAAHVHCDVTNSASVATVPVGKDDMVYGKTVRTPQDESHPIAPLGHYGASKAATEQIADDWRKRGMDITIIRPRLIIGPGRLGILGKLFRLIDLHLPVPMIGSGSNPYQFISVYDCAEVARLAWEKGVPNGAYNLGSDDPPPVRKLLGDLIKSAGSKSMLVPTPGFAVKWTLAGLDWLNVPLMDPEQYLIADEHCVRDTTAAKRDFGWTPKYRDEDMLVAAYAEYRKARQSRPDNNATAAVPAE